MSIFVVIPSKDGAQIEQAIQTASRDGSMSYYSLPKGEFFVSFKGTSRELSDALGITDGANGLAIVAAISSYYGRASTDVWEWVKTHWEG